MGKELEKVQEQEQALAKAVQDDFGDDEDLIIPILKIGQDRTNEVKAGDATPGDLINSLTGENHGTIVEFIVAGFDRGRFRVKKREDTICPDRNVGDVVCTGREGACGCHKVAYEDCPDSEEQYKAAVNRGDKEWGKGPPCATTYNFTGLIPGTEMPVKLSLMRSSAKAAKKLKTMLRFSKAPWDQVFQIETRQAGAAGQDYYTVVIKQARKPSDEERQQAVALALALRQQKVVEVGSPDDENTASGDRPAREEGIEY